MMNEHCGCGCGNYGGYGNGWLGVIAGGLGGYFLGQATNGNVFGRGNWVGAPTAGVVYSDGGCNNENCTISAINAKVTDLANNNGKQEVLDAIAGVQSTANQINRDNYALNIQNLFSLQNQFRNVDQQFCSTNNLIMADGASTRTAIENFEKRYLEDRFTDIAAENAALKSQISIAPLTCAVSKIQDDLNSILTKCSVRACIPTSGCCC